LFLLIGLSPAAEPDAGAKVECQGMELWGTRVDGEHFSMYEYSCRVPDRFKKIPPKMKPAEWVAAQSYEDLRYATLAAVAALGRSSELTPEQRMRLALEVALREGEPFASARIGFVFDDKPWWDKDHQPGPIGRNPPRLGSLAMPWDRAQTAIIREYLFPSMPHRKVSTLAVYLAKLLAEAGKLDPAIAPDLRKVIALKPKSFEADLAEAALKALAGSKTPDAP
jgi:hypothetical protein